MSIAISNIYTDAVDELRDKLTGEGYRVGFSTYGVNSMQPFINYATVKDFNLEPISVTKEKSAKANVGLALTCNMLALGADDVLAKVDKSMYLILLNNEVDIQWTYGMKQKVWEGDYPSTVAINEDGRCYFVFVEHWGIHFMYFARIDKDDMEYIKSFLNEDAPFKIKIDPDAMFKVIDGVEGYTHLRRNIFVEFNCGRTIAVYVEAYAEIVG